MSLFRTLCDDELHNIVRHASKVPNEKEWKSRLGASDLSLLSSSHGPFRGVAADVFKKITLTSHHFAVPSDSRSCPALDLLSSFGKFATRLEISALPVDGEGIKAMVREVSKQCNNVTSLCVMCSVDDQKLWEPLMQGLMDAIGNHLTELSFHPEPFISERELQGAIYWITARCMNLKKFSFSALNTSALELIQSVWYSAGNTLEDITIESKVFSPLDWAKTLSEIREHCRRLTHFRLVCNSYSKPPDDHISEMLASYWTQLQFAGLGEMNRERCEFIARACPNSKFSLLVTDNNIDGIMPLGSKLSHLKLELLEPPEERVFTDALNSCPELVDLDISSSSCRDLAFEAPFQKKKHCLRSLTLRIRGYVIVHDSLSKCSRATSELQSLVLDVSAVRDFDSFKQLAFANRQLENVELRTFRPLGVNMLVNILQSFLICDSLQSIKISFKSWPHLDNSELQNLIEKSSFLRFRRIYVEVGRHIIHG